MRGPTRRALTQIHFVVYSHNFLESRNERPDEKGIDTGQRTLPSCTSVTVEISGPTLKGIDTTAT